MTRDEFIKNTVNKINKKYPKNIDSCSIPTAIYASREDIEKEISQAIIEYDELKDKIDHTIDVRYEEDVIKAFNKFIEKWCGDYYGHLIDDDENDGEYMREKITNLTKR